MKVKFREILTQNSLSEIHQDMSVGTQSKIRKFQKLEKELPTDTGTDEYITKSQELAELDAEIIKSLHEDFEIIAEVTEKPKGKRGNPNFAKGKPNYAHMKKKEEKAAASEQAAKAAAETAASTAAAEQAAVAAAEAAKNVSGAPTAQKPPVKKTEEKSFLARRFGR